MKEKCIQDFAIGFPGFQFLFHYRLHVILGVGLVIPALFLVTGCGCGSEESGADSAEQEIRSLMNDFTINGSLISEKNEFMVDRHFHDAESFYRAKTNDSEIKVETRAETIDFIWQLLVYEEDTIIEDHTGPIFTIDRQKTPSGKYEVRISHPEDEAYRVSKLIELPEFAGDNTPPPPHHIQTPSQNRSQPPVKSHIPSKEQPHEAPSAPSSNAQLAELKLGNIELSPAFRGSINSYTATVPADVSVLNIDSRAVESDARIVIGDGEPTIGRGTGRKSLRPGENKITVEVTAPNDRTRQQYTLLVEREEPEDITMLDRSPSRISADFSPIPSEVFRSCLEDKELYFSHEEMYSFRFKTLQYRIRNIDFSVYADGPGSLRIELRDQRSGELLWEDDKVVAPMENHISLIGIGPHLRHSGTYELRIKPVHNMAERQLGILNFGQCRGLEFNDLDAEVKVSIDLENRIFSKLNFQL